MADVTLSALHAGVVTAAPTGAELVLSVPASFSTRAFSAMTVDAIVNPLPVAVASPVTLSFAGHHRRKLYTTATTTLTIPSAASLTDGFRACIYTDTGHTLTLSGAAYDLTGALVTSIPPSKTAEIGVWRGLVYAIIAGTGSGGGTTALAPLSSVMLSGPTTLSLASHFFHDLYTSASMTLTVPNAATLTDGFKVCVYTDTGHTVTLSGTVYDLAGNLVTTIPPSSKAEIEVWGGQVYAFVLGLGLASSLSHGTISDTINFVGFDPATNLDYKFEPPDFLAYTLAAGGVFAKRVAVAPVPLTDATTVATDASLGNVFTVTLAGNRTLGNPTNLVAGQEVTWIITQGGGGSHTLAYGNLFTWPGGTVPTLSTAAGAVDVVSGTYDGIKIRAAAAKAYA